MTLEKAMITKDKIMSEIVREFAKEINVFEIQTQNVEQELEQELRTYLKELKKRDLKVLQKGNLKERLKGILLDESPQNPQEGYLLQPAPRL